MAEQKRSGDRRTNPNGKPPAGTTVDRRTGLDRREIAKLQGKLRAEADGTSGLERRRGPGRRLSDFSKAAEDGEMNREQFMFLVAIDEFKKANDKPYPTWTDVLEVIRLLGYRKTQASELNLTRAEDWTESAEAASNVRPEDWSGRPVSPMGEKTRLRDADSFERREPTAAELAAEEEELKALGFDLEGLDDDDGLADLEDAA